MRLLELMPKRLQLMARQEQSATLLGACWLREWWLWLSPEADEELRRLQEQRSNWMDYQDPPKGQEG